MFTEENFEKQQAGVPNSLTTAALTDIESMHKFNRAFFITKMCKSRAVPWDRSIEPIENFLQFNKYFESNPMPNGYHRYIPQGAFCAGFVDFVMQLNGERFEKKLPFVAFDELSTHFTHRYAVST